MTITFEGIVAIVQKANDELQGHIVRHEQELKRSLTEEEINSLIHCTMCSEPNGDCTHGE